ncbi:YczE/YyaS/YitT family protein [Actinocrinis puniceicyclus]|uniref:membrane protein YczE n=1 Tax=Actinocrinis puniceicyclus TaxID=977794 RepID=UPI0034D9641E
MASRLLQLTAGLVLYGVSEALMLAPAVGVDPWDVFHTGLARITGIPVGTVLILVGGLVLLLWIPLRQRPGIGTVANIVVIGAVVDVMLAAMPAPHALWLRWAVFVAGVGLNALATGLYIGAALGPGPRDGLTTGLAAQGRSIRVVRTAIELSVLAAGWMLGGDVGLGTLVYALAIGPLMHVTVPWFSRDSRDSRVAAVAAA